MSAVVEAPVAPDVPAVSEEEGRRREVLLRAVEVLDKEGWIRGANGMFQGGPYCLLGAVAHAAQSEVTPRGSWNIPTYAYHEPMRIVCGEHNSGPLPHDWNDDCATDKKHVQDVLRRLANGLKWEDAIVG